MAPRQYQVRCRDGSNKTIAFSSVCVTDSGGQTRLLIDAGISARELRKRLELVGVDAESLNALLITHEHTDHG